MKGFMIGAVTAFVLAMLTYFGLQFGTVSTVAQYTVQSAHVEKDTFIERGAE